MNDPDATEGAVATPEAAAVDNALHLRCWGTRGSIPSPGPATASYGGNTPCVELRQGESRLVLDAGSGLRLLGHALAEDGGPVETVIFLSHFHWDHIQGFPFFLPIYNAGSSLRIIGPEQEGMGIRSLFAGQMGPVYFPVPFSAISGTIDFHHLNEGTREEGPFEVRSMRVRHPSYTVGYRISAGGRTVCYIPDNELDGLDFDAGPRWRERLVRFVGDADLLIHDAMFTDEEYQNRRGWGHSTFSQALDLACEAGVKRLLFFHHDPERTDEQLSALVDEHREVAATREGSCEVNAAAEGLAFPV